MNTGTFPTDWKTSKVVPTYKSGRNSNIENYRPISVIPVVSKIAEKLIHSQLTSYLEQNKLLKSDQFGFRKSRSTELAAIAVTDKIKMKVDEGKLVGCIFIDLSKAFDTLSHSKLISKLNAYGVDNIELEWFSDYLFNRKQRVCYGNTLSDEEGILSGVPQGSILGPLFILYFDDFQTCLKHSDPIKYADDTVIYVAGKDPIIIESRLSADMQAIADWCIENELILNLKKGKTELMMFGTAKNLKSQKETINITYGFSSISITTSYKYLGITLTPTLNPNANCDLTMKKCNSRLNLLKKIRKYLSSKAAKSVYQSMILPIITYGSLLHLNRTKTQCKRLLSFHNRSITVVNQADLQMLSPLDISFVKTCELVRHCLDGHLCSNFHNYFEKKCHGKNTRNSDCLLILPKIKLEYSRGSFYYMRAMLYNSLPTKLRKTEDFDVFKKELFMFVLSNSIDK